MEENYGWKTGFKVPAANSPDTVTHATQRATNQPSQLAQVHGETATPKTSYWTSRRKHEYSLLIQLLLCIVRYFCICRNRSFKYYEIILLLCISFHLWTMNYRHTHITPCMLPPNLKVCSPSYIYSFSPFSSFSSYLHPAPPHCSVWVDRLLSIHTSILSFPLIHTSIQPASHPTVYSSPISKYTQALFK